MIDHWCGARLALSQRLAAICEECGQYGEQQGELVPSLRKDTQPMNVARFLTLCYICEACPWKTVMLMDGTALIGTVLCPRAGLILFVVSGRHDARSFRQCESSSCGHRGEKDKRAGLGGREGRATRCCVVLRG